MSATTPSVVDRIGGLALAVRPAHAHGAVRQHLAAIVPLFDLAPAHGETSRAHRGPSLGHRSGDPALGVEVIGRLSGRELELEHRRRVRVRRHQEELLDAGCGAHGFLDAPHPILLEGAEVERHDRELASFRAAAGCQHQRLGVEAVMTPLETLSPRSP